MEPLHDDVSNLTKKKKKKPANKISQAKKICDFSLMVVFQ